ncbi:hypothetical protein PFISCL1PPCAC_6571, partial [Pristionchus fissidentatus]
SLLLIPSGRSLHPLTNYSLTSASLTLLTMGRSASKLTDKSDFVRDSVVLCDGLPRLKEPKFAGAGEGRYIFVLGNMHLSSVPVNEDMEGAAVSYQLDIIDLFLSKRIRIDHIGDFFDLGHLAGFYALNETTVVLVDYDPVDRLLRQRLVLINLKKETATYVFCRSYSINLDSFFHAQTANGEEFAVTIVPSFMDSPSSGIVYPINPLSAKPHKEITAMIDQANAHVRQTYPRGEESEARVSTIYAPFFMTNTTLGFFVDPQQMDDLIDPMNVLVLDINSGVVYLQEAKTASAFPLSITRNRPVYARWSQATNREVALMSRYRRTTGWQVLVSSLLLSVFQYVIQAAVFFVSWNCRRLSSFCLHTSLKMLLLRSRLLEPKDENFRGFGILNTRTLEWSEIKASVWNEDETRLIAFQDGQFVVGSQTSEIASNRQIGTDQFSQAQLERFRLIGNPRRMPTLTRLSSIAVQKSDRVDPTVLAMIAARIS